MITQKIDRITRPLQHPVPSFSHLYLPHYHCSTFAQWYFSLPPVTRSLLTVYFVVAAGLTFKLLPAGYLIHSWSYIFKLPVPQLWRLVTNFMIAGGFSINFLFQMIWLIRYGAAYEQAKFIGNTADAIYCLVVGMATILTVDLVLPALFGAFYHGPSIIFMFVYLWSKHNPDTQVSLFGLMQLQATYLPFALVFVDLIQGGSITHDLAGIIAGHVYYFLADVYPRASGRYFIQTPQWLSRVVSRYSSIGSGVVPSRARITPGAARPAAQPAATDNTRFRAFSGAGRRLTD